MKRIVALIILLMLISCSEQTPYADGVKYIYKVKYSNSEFEDIITVEKTVVSGFVSKLLLETEVRQDKGSSTGYSVESTVPNSTSEIKLPHPIGEYLDLTNLLPPPTIKFPIIVGDSMYSEHTVEFKHSPYNDTLVKGYIKVLGRELINNPIVHDSCWVLKVFKLDSKDTTATFYYNDEYGFTELNYSFGVDNILIYLDSLETN